MAYIQGVLGSVEVNELGLILPHEHLFTDLRGPDTPGYAQTDPDDVRRVIGPYLDEAWNAGVTTLVECSPSGVGRNPVVLQRLAKSPRIAIVAPTGVYRRGFMPKAVLAMSEDEVTEWMIAEIIQGIEGAPMRAGFINMKQFSPAGCGFFTLFSSSCAMV